MTINLIDSILANRTNTKTTPMECYGADGKALWTAFRDALYNWSVTELQADCDAAFASGKAIIASVNAELTDGRKLKFDGVDDLLRYRDAAVRFVNRDNAATAKLKAVLSFAKYRAGLSDKMSCDHAGYCYALELSGYKPTKAERELYAMPSDVALQLIDAVNDMLDESKDDKTAKSKVKATVGLDAFRKSCEVLMAEKLENIMDKTVAELDAERKEHNKAKNAMRKAVKDNAQNKIENKAA